MNTLIPRTIIGLAVLALALSACATDSSDNPTRISDAETSNMDDTLPDTPPEPINSDPSEGGGDEIISGGVRVDVKDGLLVKIAGRWNQAAFTSDQLNQPGMLCIRHNNYWCIKAVGWNGEIGQDDRNHAIFSEAKFGARAFFRLMRNYRFRHDLKTTREIFGRYAPFTDCIGSLPRNPETGECPNGPNPTLQYATTVAASMGVGIDDDIGLFDVEEKIDRDKAHTLARAVAQFELGSRFDVTPALLDQGIELAGLSPQEQDDTNNE